MSHKDAPPLTEEQQAFERIMKDMVPPGETLGLGRDRFGNYLAAFPRRMWRVWAAARAYDAAIRTNLRLSQPDIVCLCHRHDCAECRHKPAERKSVELRDKLHTVLLELEETKKHALSLEHPAACWNELCEYTPMAMIVLGKNHLSEFMLKALSKVKEENNRCDT